VTAPSSDPASDRSPDPSGRAPAPGLLASLRRVPVISLWLLLSVLALPLALQITGDLPPFAPDLLYRFFILDEPVPTGSATQALGRILGEGQLWRLVSPAFLHFGLLHIAFNSVLFFILGAGLEQRLGGWLLFVCLLLWAAFSNVAQLLYAGSPFFGGLSGVVTAMFGARLVLGYLRPTDPALYLQRPLIISLFVSLLLLSTGIAAFAGVNVANTAHWSGLAIGLVSGAILHLLVKPFNYVDHQL